MDTADSDVSVLEGDSIDEVIRSRRAQLDELRARNRAMMETLVASSPARPSNGEDTVRLALTELEKPPLEQTYLQAFMRHSAQTHAALERLEASARRLERTVSSRLAFLFLLWLLLFAALLAANGDLLKHNIQRLLPTIQAPVGRATPIEDLAQPPPDLSYDADDDDDPLDDRHVAPPDSSSEESHSDYAPYDDEL